MQTTGMYRILTLCFWSISLLKHFCRPSNGFLLSKSQVTYHEFQDLIWLPGLFRGLFFLGMQGPPHTPSASDHCPFLFSSTQPFVCMVPFKLSEVISNTAFLEMS